MGYPCLPKDKSALEGPLGNIEPTGRTFECRMTAFFVFEGAKIVCERVYWDTGTMLRQLTAEA